MSSAISLNNSGYRDSCAHQVRASVLDVCLQLGALDENSLVAEWMFNDSFESTNSNESSSVRQARTTRFTEMFSPIDTTHEQPRRRFLPFSLKAVTFPTHLCRGSKTKTNADKAPRRRLCKPKQFEKDARSGRGSESLALRQGAKSFTHAGNSEWITNERTPSVRPSTLYDDGRVSTHWQSFFQRKSPSRTVSKSSDARRSEIYNRSTMPFDTPIYSEFASPHRFDQPHIVQEDDDDADWEEVEVPNSPLYPLPNKGMNPLPLTVQQGGSRPQSTDMMDDDDDNKAIVRDASHNAFTFALPRVVFRRPLKQARLSGSSGPSSRRLSNALSVKRKSNPSFTTTHRQSSTGKEKNLPSTHLPSPSILSIMSEAEPSENPILADGERSESGEKE